MKISPVPWVVRCLYKKAIGLPANMMFPIRTQLKASEGYRRMERVMFSQRLKPYSQIPKANRARRRWKKHANDTLRILRLK